MKVVQINTFSYKATGSIMMNIHRQLIADKFESYVVWGRGRKPENDHEISIADEIGVKFHGIHTRITDKTGFASRWATRKLLRTLEEIKPDVIHLHNLHGYYINIEMLFDYIRAKKIRLIWTLHDCWTFTGHCAYFDSVDCIKWKTGCYDCEQLTRYPASKLLDASVWNWKKKKELFTGLNIILVTPSKWLKALVEQSYLNTYPVEVIHNGIDTSIFKPTASDFRKNNGLENKFIILGVASEWTERKGLKDFIKLDQLFSKKMKDKCKIILVGLTKKQVKQMPSSIIALERTANIQELIELYSVSDIFFNPTYEENFPTTNLEALACGTPVITYKTGGSPESITKECGFVLEQGDLQCLVALIEKNCIPKLGFNFNRIATTDAFSKEKMIKYYEQLYIRIGGSYDRSTK